MRAQRWAFGVRPAYKMVDTCAGEFPSATPYLYSSLRRGERSTANRPEVHRHTRQRSEPYWAGRRVRLLLRARVTRTARPGIRDDHDQLESGDCLDRLRHLRQAVLRAADAGARARHRRSRAARWRDRAAWRSDSAQADARSRSRGCADTRHISPTRSTSPRIGNASTRSRASSEFGSLKTGPRRVSPAPSKLRTRIGYPVLVRPSYVLGGRAMEIVYDEDSLREYFERAARVSEDRPVLIDQLSGGRVRGRRRCDIATESRS